MNGRQAPAHIGQRDGAASRREIRARSRVQAIFAKIGGGFSGVGFNGPPARRCRFIEGEPVDLARICGAPVRAGSSYCDAHHARCHKPRRPDAADDDGAAGQ